MKRLLLAAAAVTGSMLMTAPVAGAMTYTLEPADFDGVFGITANVTQQQLGFSLCPCTKIPYPADVVGNGVGVAALASVPLRSGDIVVGYSGGSVVMSGYLNSHTPPPGVKFVLLGDPSNPDGLFAGTGVLWLFGGGIPSDTPAPVTIISRQYDGWADFPTNIFAPGYLLAVYNAAYGANTLHNDYTEAALLDNPANVTWTEGNIKYELVPTQNLPINQGVRDIGLGFVADVLDAIERPFIDAAYSHPMPTAAARSAAASVQAKIPSPNQIPGPPEPVLALNTSPQTATVPTPSTTQVAGASGPVSTTATRTAAVLGSKTRQTPAPAKVATDLVTSNSTTSDPTTASRSGGRRLAASEVQSPRQHTNSEPQSRTPRSQPGSATQKSSPIQRKPVRTAR